MKRSREFFPQQQQSGQTQFPIFSESKLQVLPLMKRNELEVSVAGGVQRCPIRKAEEKCNQPVCLVPFVLSSKLYTFDSQETNERLNLPGIQNMDLLN